jgi:hypothetical protein
MTKRTGTAEGQLRPNVSSVKSTWVKPSQRPEIQEKTEVPGNFTTETAQEGGAMRAASDEKLVSDPHRAARRHTCDPLGERS